jgi:hypothetical protein
MKCPYCGSTEDCDHLFAVYDIGFNEIEAGILYDNSAIHDIILEFFIDIIIKYGWDLDSAKIRNLYIKSYWLELVKENAHLDIRNKSELESELYFDNNSIQFDYAERFIKPIEHIHEDGGIGTNSTYKIYYSKDVLADYEKLINLVESEFLQERVNLDLM